MTYTLLLRRPAGWTDYLGDGANEFQTADQARSASAELDAAWGTTSEWKVVESSDLASYELIS